MLNGRIKTKPLAQLIQTLAVMRFAVTESCSGREEFLRGLDFCSQIGFEPFTKTQLLCRLKNLTPREYNRERSEGRNWNEEFFRWKERIEHYSDKTLTHVPIETETYRVTIKPAPTEPSRTPKKYKIILEPVKIAPVKSLELIRGRIEAGRPDVLFPEHKFNFEGTQAWDMVHLVLQQGGVSPDEPPDPYKIARNLNINVVHLDFSKVWHKGAILDQEFAGITYSWKKGRTKGNGAEQDRCPLMVLIDCDEPLFRRRFTLTHEILEYLILTDQNFSNSFAELFEQLYQAELALAQPEGTVQPNQPKAQSTIAKKLLRERLLNTLASECCLPCNKPYDIFARLAANYRMGLFDLKAKFNMSLVVVAIKVAVLRPSILKVYHGIDGESKTFTTLTALNHEEQEELTDLQEQLETEVAKNYVSTFDPFGCQAEFRETLQGSHFIAEAYCIPYKNQPLTLLMMYRNNSAEV